MHRFLIVGARGKTGREVTRALLDRGATNLTGATRSPNAELPDGVLPVSFDWTNSDTWDAALAGVEALWLVKPGTPNAASAVRDFLKRSLSLKRVVLLSEIDAETRDVSTAERQVELAVESSPLDWTILRLNWFMQNFTSPGFYLGDIRDRGELVVPTGGAATSFVDTRDIGDVAATCLLQPGNARRTLTLTGPEALSWTEAASRISAAAGYPVRHIDVPLAEFSERSRAGGASAESIAYAQRYYTSVREGRTAVVTPEIERLLGRPARNFSAFIGEYASVWRRPAATT